MVENGLRSSKRERGVEWCDEPKRDQEKGAAERARRKELKKVRKREERNNGARWWRWKGEEESDEGRGRELEVVGV